MVYCNCNICIAKLTETRSYGNEVEFKFAKLIETGPLALISQLPPGRLKYT